MDTVCSHTSLCTPEGESPLCVCMCVQNMLSCHRGYVCVCVTSPTNFIHGLTSVVEKKKVSVKMSQLQKINAILKKHLFLLFFLSFLFFYLFIIISFSFFFLSALFVLH